MTKVGSIVNKFDRLAEGHLSEIFLRIDEAIVKIESIEVVEALLEIKARLGKQGDAISEMSSDIQEISRKQDELLFQTAEIRSVTKEIQGFRDRLLLIESGVKEIQWVKSEMIKHIQKLESLGEREIRLDDLQALNDEVRKLIATLGGEIESLRSTVESLPSSEKKQELLKYLENYRVSIHDRSVRSPYQLRLKDLFHMAMQCGRVADEEARARCVLKGVPQKYDYQKRDEINSNISTSYKSADEVIKCGKGVCGELSYVYVAMARFVGLKTSYMSMVLGKVPHGAALVAIKSRALIVDIANSFYEVVPNSQLQTVAVAYAKKFGVGCEKLSKTDDAQVFLNYNNWNL